MLMHIKARSGHNLKTLTENRKRRATAHNRKDAFATGHRIYENRISKTNDPMAIMSPAIS
jgi:hypothetical protein